MNPHILRMLEGMFPLREAHFYVSGIGMASMDPISITMLSNYFEKRRGFANSMANSGGSLGGLIFAPLLTAMFDYYGYSGAMLLVGAFLLHGFIGAALFRSQSFYTKRYQQTTRKRKPNKLDTRADPLGDESKALIKNGYTIVRSDRERQREQVSGSLPTSVCSDREQWISVQLSEASENHTITSLPNLAPHAKPLRRRTETEPSDGYVMDRIAELREIRTSDYIGGSQFSIPVVINLDNHASSHDNKETKGYLSCFNYFSKLFDFSLFRNPVFITYLFGAGLLCTPHALTMMYIAPHAKEMGADSAGVAKVLTIYSAVDLCSRIIVAFISDRKWIRRSTMIAISSCTTGIMAHLMVFFTSYNWFLFYAVVFGVIGGVYFSLYPVVIVDYLTLEKLQRCLGFTILFQAIFVSGASAIIGEYLFSLILPVPNSRLHLSSLSILTICISHKRCVSCKTNGGKSIKCFMFPEHFEIDK